MNALGRASSWPLPDPGDGGARLHTSTQVQPFAKPLLTKPVQRSGMTIRRPLLTLLLEAVLRPEQVVLAWEADKLEAAHGRDALGHVRDQILKANKHERRRLYRLHDEIARRYADPMTLEAVLAGR